jgi:short-subunit dehydrogenase
MKENKSDNLFTLITGASSGIGKALAVESAMKKQNLVLIALPDENLEEFSESLRGKYRIKVKFFEIDLTEKNAALQVYLWCIKQKLSVNRLINNAGFGYRGSFEDYSLEFYETMMRLNMTSVVHLTRLFVPELRKHESASILNLGSMAAFLPIPYKTVYAATKAFIYSFSIALKEELRDSQIRVHILCPGGVPTNRDVQKRIATDGWLSRISMLYPQKVAQITFRKMENHTTVIVPGLVNRIYMLAGKFVTKSMRTRAMAKVFKKQQTLISQKKIVVH